MHIGREFAFESPEWNNGVFTYALREALRGNTADIDNNGTIEVSELSNYVAKKVISLTNGLQHPTSRSNNIENDFVVY